MGNGAILPELAPGAHVVVLTVSDSDGSLAEAKLNLCASLRPPAGPKLAIRREGDKFVVTWPRESSAYNLQHTIQPEDPFSWISWPEPVIAVGDQNTTIVPPQPDAGGFFRLIRGQP